MNKLCLSTTETEAFLSPSSSARRLLPLRRQRGIALITVLLVMTAITLLGLAAQGLVESNIKISGAQYQVRVARGAAVAVMNVFRQLGRPRLATLVPAGFQPATNLDLSNASLTASINDAQAVAITGSRGLVQSQTYVYNATTPAFIRADYLGRSQVPPGNEPAELFPVTINSGVYCADFFRLVSTATTTGGARGAVDQNMYIVSPCLN